MPRCARRRTRRRRNASSASSASSPTSTSSSPALRANWEHERDAIAAIRELNEKIEQAKADAEQAERAGDLERAAEIRYGTLIELDKQLQAANDNLKEIHADGKPMLSEEVTEEDIAEVVARWTGIPVSRLLEGEMQKLLRMEDELHARVDRSGRSGRRPCRTRSGARARASPIRTVRSDSSCSSDRRASARRSSRARSPTYLFDDEKAMIRLDMSEYQERHTVSRLVGAPPGYVGYDEGGQLTEAVRRRPYSVVLLDEVEKAHQDVFNVLLQVMDEGRLTDSKGRTVDFRNAILIMTSNLGSEYLLQESVDEEKVLDVVNSFFRPEFLNRLDEILIFRRLTARAGAHIVDIQIERVAKRLAERGITLRRHAEAMDLLGRMGYDPSFGARPLKRVIRRELEDRIAKLLLEGEVARRLDGAGRRRRRRSGSEGRGLRAYGMSA